MSPERTILSVTQLNRILKQWMENQFTSLWIEGEVSNATYASSGHCYFSLKDSNAQIRCVHFKSLDKIKNGDHLCLKGRLTLYEPRGDYQLIVEKIEHVGQGNLYRQFIELKNKLEKLGLFSTERKKSIPLFPHAIGVITSSIGAAQHDILTTLQRRYPLAHIIFYFSDVQGDKAVSQLIAAIEKANHEAQCDVLILARGGGSLEDLYAFNAEPLAYAIFNSTLPIVTGIGHETDFTIADFVADYRAATPTAAAEKVSPDHQKLTETCGLYEQKLYRAIKQLIDRYQYRITLQTKKMLSPDYRLSLYTQSIDFLHQQLHQHLEKILIQKKWNLQSPIEKLASLSPLATLARGYSIAMNQSGEVLRDTEHVQVHEKINLHLAKGTLSCQILEIQKDG